MLARLKKSVFSDVINIRGPRTKRKIFIIESDDWGALAIPDDNTYKKLLRSGVKVDEDPYCQYDNLADKEDLGALFDLLTSYEDINGRHPVITANAVVANPAFERIYETDYQEYHYETIDKTFQRFSGTGNSLDTWREGIREGVFMPQFHGREHLNVQAWLRELRSGNRELLNAFEVGVFGVPLSEKIGNRRDCRAALDFQLPADINYHREVLEEGLQLFNKIFGFGSKSFIAPCYTWSAEDEKILARQGVEILQGSFVQKTPQGAGQPYKKFRNYTGKVNPYGQSYLIRNAFLEPAIYPGQEVLGKCVKDIATAFKYGKPAIVGSHRLNFIGSRQKANRDISLRLLRDLLKTVTSRWPEVEFIASSSYKEVSNSKHSDG